MRIIGVDFSGRDSNNTTWVTEAVLQDDCLKIESCCRPSKNGPESRRKLKCLLRKLPDDSVAAMDFPFSVPQPFAERLVAGASTMPDLWQAVAKMDLTAFNKLRDEFVKHYGEMMRRGDGHFGGPISPLKTGGPNMLPMTFYGMRMMHHLWESEKRFRVPPLEDDGRTGPELLETMPGVLLRTLGLPAQNYKRKNKTNGRNSKKVRSTILSGLRKIPSLSLEISDELCDKCVAYDDCLDSLVAAVGAAMWKQCKPKFLHPRILISEDDEIKAARLEGWLYAPKEIWS